MLKMMAQAADIIAVTILLYSFGMKRWKTPVLTFGEKIIGWRAATCFDYKNGALAPDIVAVAVDAERKVEIESYSAGLGLLAQTLQLLVGLPLHIEMVLLDIFIIFTRAQHTIATRRRPIAPGFILALDFGAKGRIVFNRGMVFDEALKARSSFGRFSQNGAGQLFEDAALERHKAPIVNQGRSAQPFNLGLKAR